MAENVNDNAVNVVFMGSVNHYAIDPKIEKVYEDQIALLKKQIELLEAKMGSA